MSDRALLMLSGGLDSALCAYEALASGRSLVLHHIRLRNHEGREALEQVAAERVVRWLRRRGLDTFTYSESAFDHGSLHWIPKDVNVWAFMAAVVLADPRNADVESVIVPRHLDAFGHVVDPSGLAERSNELVQGYAALTARRQVGLEFPIGHMTKTQVVAALPPDLRACCWYCRRPNGAKPCHRCATCEQVDAALREIEK